MRGRAGTWLVAAILVLGVAAAVLGVALDRLGAYGSTAGLTPQLDRLATGGVVFERAWTTAPLTIPAHASMHTGLLPPLHGLRTNAPGRRLPPASARPYATVAELMRAAGFRTGAFVSASVLRADRTGLDAGFDVYDEVPAAAPGALHDAERPALETVEAALEWVRDGETPVFLWVHLFDPHAPYLAPTPWGAGAEHAADATGYDGEVRYVDHAVGRLREGLAEAGLEDPVLVVVSDHGEGLGAHGEATHGYLLHEETLHVPLIVSAPGLVAAGLRRDEDVSVIDVAPTLVTLGGLSVPPTMDGRALFAGGGQGTPRAPYAESLYGWEAARWAQVFALRTGRRKLVDAGPRTLVLDLEADPTEERPLVLPALPDAGDPTEDPEAHRLVEERLRHVAGLPPLAAPTEGSDELAGGSYWSASSADEGILPRAENAALPSPYDRMDVLAQLDRGRSLLASGAVTEALEAFRDAVRSDPGNPQAHRWLGRALLAAQAPTEAARAYRAAFERGWRHPDCVAKALQASVLASEARDAEEVALGLAFLTQARGKGVPQDGPAYVFEALLLLADGRPEDARRALDNARREPSTEWLENAIRGVAERLP
jgi:arylsulfatase A-like enzyme